MADTNTTGSSVDKPIENLEVNGTKYVIMPKKDNNGNVIVDTYATKTELSNEINARKSADTTLQNSINSKQNKLTFDTTPTAGSSNPVTSDGIKKAIDATKTELSNEINARKSADTTLQNSINSKQNKLTFDTTPTAGSSNPVTSDGIKKAIDAKTVDLSNYYTKTQVDTTYLKRSGGTMTGDINMNRYNLIDGQSPNTGIYCAGNDNGGTLGTTGANINIKSWYGVGFINGLSSSNTYNKVTVGIDVREGIVHARSFDGNASSATKLATKRTISVSGTGLTATAKAFDGTGNITIPITLANALLAIAGVTPSAGKIPVFTGANTASLASITDFMKTLLGKASAGDVRSAIGAVDASGAGVVAGNVSNPNAWWVKLGGTIPLIIQGGHSNAGSFTYPITLSAVIGIWIQKIGYHWAFNPRVTGWTNTAVTWNYTDQGDHTENHDSFLLIVGY